jgi:long-chain acyl-CoA synthetase
VKVYTFKEIVEKGKNSKLTLTPPTFDTVYTLCYTSGTTGNPKGVMNTHGNIIVATNAVGKVIQFSNNDTHISYLPLAHVMERLVLCSTYNWGYKYGLFQGDIFKLKEDLPVLRPTVFPSVPRLLNRFYDVMQGKIQEQTGIKKFLLKWAVNTKLRML